jgi:hypothetical protein
MTTPTSEQVRDWEKLAKHSWRCADTVNPSTPASSAFITGYLRAKTDMLDSLMEKLARFGAMVLRSQEFQTELAVECGFLVPNEKAGGYLYTISESEIEQLLKE